MSMDAAVDCHAHVFDSTWFAFATDARWLPDDRDRRQVLWETPARLFGFS